MQTRVCFSEASGAASMCEIFDVQALREDLWKRQKASDSYSDPHETISLRTLQ